MPAFMLFYRLHLKISIGFGELNYSCTFLKKMNKKFWQHINSHKCSTWNANFLAMSVTFTNLNIITYFQCVPCFQNDKPAQNVSVWLVGWAQTTDRVDAPGSFTGLA